MSLGHSKKKNQNAITSVMVSLFLIDYMSLNIGLIKKTTMPHLMRVATSKNLLTYQYLSKTKETNSWSNNYPKSKVSTLEWTKKDLPHEEWGQVIRKYKLLLFWVHAFITKLNNLVWPFYNFPLGPSIKCFSKSVKKNKVCLILYHAFFTILELKALI